MPTTETESSKAVGMPLSKRHPCLLMTPFSCSLKAFVTSCKPVALTVR
jgi:hypothetical protein